jgi:nucleoside-diphosphate-sugar epimerase
MIVFVSGGGAFIGRRLCEALQAQGHTVVAGLRRPEPGPWNRVVISDLTGEAIAPQELQDISCVIHLAGKAHALAENAQDEREYYDINVGGTQKLLETSRTAGVRRFLFFSSVKVMGDEAYSLVDESLECRPETPYGTSKLEAEQLVLRGGYVPEPVVLRPAMVYGSSRKGNLPRMIDAIARGRFPPLQEIGNKRSMVCVDDLVSAACLSIEKQIAVGKVYIVTDGCTYSTRNIYEWICEALDKPVPHWTIPVAMLRVLAKVGDGIGRVRGRRFMFDSDSLDKLVGSANYSSEKIQRELGFQPAWNLRSALPGIVSWLERNQDRV